MRKCSWEGDPYGESSAENVLKYLNPGIKLPDSIAIFTKRGCAYCARVKELLSQYKMPYEEVILTEHFSIKTVKAISDSTKLPQVFINGRKVGGAEELEKYLNVEGPSDLFARRVA
ncbi:MAG TPA: glutaredoxin domain-containing protein [Bacteriovoracaceae bacterium]|nr:glutaredoxin domain-containing protein [Bacteriovoracaceae bacterium]